MSGCAASTVLPHELFDARQAYAHVSARPAAQLIPAVLHSAREALAVAEKSFRDDPTSNHTRDLATLAYREAQRANRLATIASDSALTTEANSTVQSSATAVVEKRR